MQNDKPQPEFLGRGWSFPPVFNRFSKTVEMTEKNEDIQKSLQILLSTTIGERVMQPKYGCNMDDMIFESMDLTTKTTMRDKIQTAILYFEPRINVVSISMNAVNELEGEVLIEIEYIIRATNSRYNFVFPYYINEATELNIEPSRQ